MPDKNENNYSKTRYSLIGRITDPHDQDAWKEFIDYYEHYIYCVLRKTGLPPEQSEEFKHDIIVLLWEKIPQLAYDKEKGNFRSWLSAIIHNRIKSYHKKNTNRSKLMADEAPTLVDQLEENYKLDDLEEKIEEEWNTRIFETAWINVKTNINQTAQIVFQEFLDGKSSSEISSKHNLPETSVRQYKHRVKAMLADEIKRLNDAFPF